MFLLHGTAVSVGCKMAQAQTISCPSPQEFSQQTSTGVEVYSRHKTYRATEGLKTTLRHVLSQETHSYHSEKVVKKQPCSSKFKE